MSIICEHGVSGARCDICWGRHIHDILESERMENRKNFLKLSQVVGWLGLVTAIAAVIFLLTI